MIAARGTHATVIPLKSGIRAGFRTLYLCDEAPACAVVAKPSYRGTRIELAWVPACAGMTERGLVHRRTASHVQATLAADR